MAQSEIDVVRALLSSKPRPVSWRERRRRIEEVGSAWPVASDIRLEQVNLRGLQGEWSIAPGSDTSRE
jgi:monoterpene epsilon-lactone hydrolase